MRIPTRLASGVGAAILALTLAACGGGSGPNGSSPTSAASGGSSSAVATPSASADAAFPTQPVCAMFSKDVVSKYINLPVYSTSDVDVSAGEQSSLCDYYIDTDQLNHVRIHLMTLKQAAWEQQLGGIGTVDSGGMKTVVARYPGMGDDALRETAVNDMVSVIEYQVLLNRPGIVAEVVGSVTLASGSVVHDGDLVNLIKSVVIPTLNKL